jgi:hypothetical protein
MYFHEDGFCIDVSSLKPEIGTSGRIDITVQFIRTGFGDLD